MRTQNQKHWIDKVTKRQLQAYLLKQEGATRHIICKYMMVKRKVNGSFVKGQKWCQHCSTRLDIPELYCPCCGYKLRTHCRWKEHSTPEREQRLTHEI